MHVLITRPEGDADDLKSRLAALGCAVTVAPLLTIEICEIAADVFDGATGIIATSRNGLRALAASPALQKALALPVFVVGPATEALARTLGFANVRAGHGTAATLIPVIGDTIKDSQARLIHLAGDHLAFDLKPPLTAIEIDIGAIRAYRSIAAASLDTDVATSLSAGAFDAVVLMSRRTAQTWSELVSALKPRPDLTKMTHICLSQTVAAELEALAPLRIETADRPTAEGLIALVYRLAPNCKNG